MCKRFYNSQGTSPTHFILFKPLKVSIIISAVQTQSQWPGSFKTNLIAWSWAFCPHGCYMLFTFIHSRLLPPSTLITHHPVCLLLETWSVCGPWRRLKVRHEKYLILKSNYEYAPYTEEPKGKKMSSRNFGRFFTLPAFRNKLGPKGNLPCNRMNIKTMVTLLICPLRSQAQNISKRYKTTRVLQLKTNWFLPQILWSHP